MKPITIYTSSQCHYCHEAKNFFDKNNIDYIEYNISNDKEARRELMRKGYMSVPLIIIGEQVVVGYDKEELSGLLGL